MKTVIVITLFTIAVFLLWRLNSTKKPPFSFSAGTLHIHAKGCSIDLPSLGSEDELVDVLDLSRHFLKLPNGGRVVYERVDFPSTYDFAFPADAIVAKVFGFESYRVTGERGGVFFIEGKDYDNREFTVAAVSERGHRLQLLYPLGKMDAEIFEKCLIEGKKEKFPKEPQIPESAIRPNWNESEIIIENMIEKDM